VYEVTENRIGKFELPRADFRRSLADIKNILNKCVVVRCESMFHKDCLEYIAYSEYFESVEENGPIPFYEWETCNIKVNKVHNG